MDPYLYLFDGAKIMLLIELSKSISNYLQTQGFADAPIYIPTYRWMLENKAMDIIERLRDASKTRTIVLLDYNTSCDVDSEKKPISHAYLVKAYAEGLYPFDDLQIKKTNNPIQLTLFDE